MTLADSSFIDVWPGIKKTAGVVGGDACIRDTRISVWLLEGLRRLGETNEKLLGNYPGLSQTDLDNAWVYVAANASEIEDAIRRNDEA